MKRYIWAAVLFASVCLAGCGGDGGGGGAAPAGLAVTEVEGTLLATDGSPRAGVLVEAPGSGARTTTGADGSFRIAVPEDDPRIRVGGDTDVSYIVRLALGGGVAKLRKAEGPQRLERPLFSDPLELGPIPGLEPGRLASGFEAQDPELPGLRLVIAEGTDLKLPEGASGVAVHVLSSDRLPLPLPEGSFSRLAVFVGPLGLRFDPPASLWVPNAEGLAPEAELEWWFLGSRGEWVRRGTIQVSGDGLEAGPGSVARGGIYVALPEVPRPATDITGRVLGSGNEPLEGYTIAAPGGYAAVTGADGFFHIEGVPLPPGFEFRVAAIPPPEFRREFFVSPARAAVPGGVTDFGSLVVRSVLRSGAPPRVTYDPPPGAGGVSELTHVRVTFDRPMNPATVGLQLVRGISREQRGVPGELLTRTTAAGGLELEFIPDAPLRNGTFYTVFIPKEASDLDGNRVEPDETSSRFTVRDNPADPSDGALRLHTGHPLQGTAGDEVILIGDNLLGEGVRFGSTEALVLEFRRDIDSRGRDLLRVRVPRGIAGEVTVQVKDRDGNFQGSLPFQALPFIDALDPEAVPMEGGATLRGRGLHLGTSAEPILNGVRGGAFRAVGPSAFCPEELDLECFEVDLPAGAPAGLFALEVSGFRTEPRFVVVRRGVDLDPPRVASVVPDPAEGIDPAGPVVLAFSEILDPRSTVEVSAGGAPLAGVEVRLEITGEGATQVVIQPPPGGFPLEATVTFRAGPGVRDLAGNRLDQDPATAEPDDFVLEVGPPPEEPPPEEPPPEEPPPAEPAPAEPAPAEPAPAA